MSKKTYVDPPQGYKYGFPKEVTEEAYLDFRKFLLDNGYPEKDVEFAMKYCRMWEEEMEDENNG